MQHLRCDLKAMLTQHATWYLANVATYNIVADIAATCLTWCPLGSLDTHLLSTWVVGHQISSKGEAGRVLMSLRCGHQMRPEGVVEPDWCPSPVFAKIPKIYIDIWVVHL